MEEIFMSGQNIFNAALVMHKTGEEIEAMLESLHNMLNKRFEDIFRIEEIGDDSNKTNGWIYIDVVRNYALYKNPRTRKPTAWLAIQIKLCDRAEAELAGEQPLVYVLFSMGGEFEIDEFLLQKAVTDGYVLESERIWRFSDSEDHSNPIAMEHKPQFAYVVPLTSLNGPEDLKTLIVDPIYSLLCNNFDFRLIDNRVLRF
jgi:hypothetical protein